MAFFSDTIFTARGTNPIHMLRNWGAAQSPAGGLRKVVFEDVSEFVDDADTRRPSIAKHTAGMVTDAQNKIVSVSPSFEKHTGFTLADCVGKPPSFLQGPDTSESAIAQFRSLVLTRKQGTVTVVNYSKSGKPFLNEVMIFPMHDQGGNFLGFTSMHGLL